MSPSTWTSLERLKKAPDFVHKATGWAAPNRAQGVYCLCASWGWFGCWSLRILEILEVSRTQNLSVGFTCLYDVLWRFMMFYDVWWCFKMIFRLWYLYFVWGGTPMTSLTYHALTAGSRLADKHSPRTAIPYPYMYISFRARIWCSLFTPPQLHIIIAHSGGVNSSKHGIWTYTSWWSFIYIYLGVFLYITILIPHRSMEVQSMIHGIHGRPSPAEYSWQPHRGVQP